MKAIPLAATALIAWGGFAIFNTASATTFYVRTDGGNAQQCNGRADAAYPGSGSGRSCAWNHPFVALPPTSSSSPMRPRIRGGDTLVIDPGSYQMGADWKNNSQLYGACSLNYPSGCTLAAIPSGTASQPTRIEGKGYNTGCKAPPELWGSDHSYQILDLDGSSNVVVNCLNVTDHSACIEYDSNASIACNRNNPPFGAWASTGLHAQDSHNVVLANLRIHGLASTGIQAGRISNWTLNNVKLIGNGSAGWNGDLGGSNSSNSGNIVFNVVEIGWNGCTEKYPSTTIYACWGQQENGYGDGLGTASTGGHWTINRSYIHNNTQDGLDLRYADGSGRVDVTYSRFEGNAGNQVKIKGPALIQNSVLVDNCAFFNGKYNMSSGDNCRAGGGALFLVATPGSLVSVAYNTMISQGGCITGSQNGNSSSEVDLYDNVLIGQPVWGNGSSQSCMFYGNGSAARVNIKGNVIWNAHYYTKIPSGNVFANPRLKSESLGSFDPTPMAGSPVIDTANRIITAKKDLYLHQRPVGAGYDVGAVEYGSTH